MAVHNDAVLGFPIEVFHNKDSLLEALLRLIDEGFVSKPNNTSYKFACYPHSQLGNRSALEPFVTAGYAGEFEIFLRNDSPIYLIWRFNHKWMDAISLLRFTEALRSYGLGTLPRFSTPQQLLAVTREIRSSNPWIDTFGDQYLLDQPGNSPRKYWQKLGASAAITSCRMHGTQQFNLGILKAGRPLASPINPGNHLQVKVLPIEVDPFKAATTPLTELERLVGLLDSREGILQNSSVSEEVDILINPQTLDWYSIICEQLAPSGRSFSLPFLYHQVNKLSNQVRFDIELWHKGSVILRNRTSNSFTSPNRRIYSSQCIELYGGKRPTKSLTVYGGAKSFERFDAIVASRWELLRQRNKTEYQRASRFRELLGLIPRRFAIGLSATNSCWTFLEALTCWKEGRIIHYVCESSTADSRSFQLSSDSLGVPLAWIDGENISLFEPNGTLVRNIENDHLSGVAYILSSGSTGVPKVTLLTKAMAENIVGNSYMYLSLEEDSRLLMLSSPQFDAIYFELLLCLSMPYLPERIGAISSNIRQVKTMLGEGVFSHLVCTPTVLLLLLQAGVKFPPILMSVGEKLSNTLLKSILNSTPDGQVFDLYGPSEAGIWSALRRASSGESSFYPLKNVYFRMIKQWEGGNNSPFHIGVLGEAGETQFEVSSGDEANFDLESQSIRTIRRIDGIIKISGKRFSKQEIINYLLAEYDFDCALLTEVEDESLAEQSKVLLAVSFSTFSRQVDLVGIGTFHGAKVLLTCISDAPLTKTGKLDIQSLASVIPEQAKDNNLKSISKAPVDSNEASPLFQLVKSVWSEYITVSSEDASFNEMGGTSLDALRIQTALIGQGIDAPPILPEISFSQYIDLVNQRSV